MSQQQIRIFDLNQQDCLDFANPFFSHFYQTGLQGLGLLHISHPACDSPEMSLLQHAIVIHLKPKVKFERRLAELHQIENPNIGDIAIIPAEVSHWHGTNQEVEGIVLVLEPPTLIQYAQELIDSEQVELIPTFAQPDPFIYGVGLALKQELDSGNVGGLVYLEFLFNAFVMHLLRHYATKQHKTPNYQGGFTKQQIKQIIDYIQIHLAQNISLDDLARLVNLSTYHFCRLFKQSMGLTPHQYIIHQRVEQAKQLLLNSNLTIVEVANLVGFANQSHLNYHFKRIVGATPRKIKYLI
ncbi:Transcriptional Regulator, AraC family [Stanieria sp. NIES-3757]|nr:Transcriptional Regulator, AraC family [Stanieria sp. NIES-3757]